MLVADRELFLVVLLHAITTLEYVQFTHLYHGRHINMLGEYDFSDEKLKDSFGIKPPRMSIEKILLLILYLCVFRPGNGFDQITDSDGVGRIVIGNTELSGEIGNGIYSAEQNAAMWTTNIASLGGEVRVLASDYSGGPDADYFPGSAAEITILWADGDEVIQIQDFRNGDLGITLGNIAPAAQNDYATTDENASVTLNVLANDVDIDGIVMPSTVTLHESFGPSHGTVSMTGGLVRYTPNTDFTGKDGFNYCAINKNSYGTVNDNFEMKKAA